MAWLGSSLRITPRQLSKTAKITSGTAVSQEGSVGLDATATRGHELDTEGIDASPKRKSRRDRHNPVPGA